MCLGLRVQAVVVVSRWLLALGVFLASWVAPAHAAVEYEYMWDAAPGGPSGWTTAASACAFGASKNTANYATESFPSVYTAQAMSGTPPYTQCKYTVKRTGLSGSSTASDPLNYRVKVVDEPKCKANLGKVGVVNWTEGYTRTPDEGDRAAVGGYNAPPADGNMCQAGCVVSAQTSGPGVEFFVSQQPTAQGLYRRSADFPTIGKDEECTASDSAPNSPVAPEPKCTGTLGQVNNKTVCISTPSAPVTTAPMPAPSSEPIAGNPSAGAKPTSGAGSGTGSIGRTPDAGTGGNAGGSMAAAYGGKGGTAGGTSTGTGTVTAPPTGEEQAACGAPGQPVCAVKVDEKDMPDGKDAFTKSQEALEKNATDTRSGIDKAGAMQAPSWSFSFQLPTGCQPYDTGIKGFVLDPCKYQSTIHDLMSMIWAAVTAFCIIGMVSRTIREA